MIENKSNTISIEKVTKRFGDLTAVDALSLKVEKGELFAFLGPNGAGKTTTIKMLVGLLSPTAGMIKIQDIDMDRNGLEAKRLVSYIPDVPYLYDRLSAEEFMYFVCSIYRMENRSKIEEKIEEILSIFGLYERRDNLIEHFSHGLRQRLVFSAALVHDPEILVIDEPMVGLDPESARLVKDILRNFVKQGKTVFMSTHTLSIAEELADRIGIIDKGSLIALGKKEHLETISGLKSGNLEDIFLEITKDKK